MNVNNQGFQREMCSLHFQIMTWCKGYEQYQIVFNCVLSFRVDTLLYEYVGKINTQDEDFCYWKKRHLITFLKQCFRRAFLYLFQTLIEIR